METTGLQKIMDIKTLKKELKKVKFIYAPYRKIKDPIVTKIKSNAVKKDGLKFLTELEKILPETGFPFFADFGTLLGIIRDHDFIAWDDDLDYGVALSCNEDWNKLQQILEKNGYKKIRQFYLGDSITEQTYRKNNLTIDFFGHFTTEDGAVVYDYYRKKGYSYESDREYHARKDRYAAVTATKKEYLREIQVTVPENAEEFLASVYTEQWRVPNPGWTAEDCINGIILDEMGYVDYLPGCF